MSRRPAHRADAAPLPWRHAAPLPWRRAAAGACGIAAAAAMLAGCGDPAPTAPASSSTHAPAAAGAGSAPSPAPSNAHSRAGAVPGAVARSGARFGHALAARGIPADALSDDATLAQLARGLCNRSSDGTPDAEILDRLGPVVDYARSIAPGDMPDDRIAQAFLEAARESTC